jgi:hypothetical protein
MIRLKPLESNIIVEPATSIEQCKMALEISLQSFYPDGYTSLQKANLEMNWFSEPSFSPEMILLLKNDSEQILGGVRSVSRKMARFNQIYECLGISEIFIRPKFQGRGYSNLLVTNLLESAHKQGYDLAIGVSRKKIDGFYLKYNFFGLANYSKIIIESEDALSNEYNSHIYEFRPLRRVELDNRFYENSYKSVFGRMLRTNADWDFMFDKIVNNRWEGYSIHDNSLLGYVIVSEGNIIELSYGVHVDLKILLKSLCVLTDKSTLTLKLPSSHSLFNKDLGLDVTFIERECVFGGHIVKVLNLEKALVKYSERINDIKFNRVKQFWHESDVSQEDSLIYLDEVRSILDSKKTNGDSGIDNISLELTRLLLGVKSPYHQLISVEFRHIVEPFFISVVDEF